MYRPRSYGGKLLSQLHRPKNGIYFIAGHGEDNPKIEKKIPKGCMYCTFAECGLETFATDPRFVNIEYEFIKGNPIFKKPTSVNKLLYKLSKQYSSEIQNIPEIRNTKSSISIKNYGRTFKKITKNYTAERARHTYIYSTYSPFSFFISYSIHNFCNDLAVHLKHAFLEKDMVRDFFNNLNYRIGYSGIIKFTEQETPSKDLRVYQMFNPEDFDFFYVMLEIYMNDENREQYFEYKSEEQIYNDIYRFVEETINNSNIDLTSMIEDSFKYSFFPSVDMVLKFYKTSTIRNILDFVYEFNYWFTITQQDLFEYLPGTYYNFICRNTYDLEKTMERRQLSPLNPIGTRLLKKSRKSKSKSHSKRTVKSLPRNGESLHQTSIH